MIVNNNWNSNPLEKSSVCQKSSDNDFLGDLGKFGNIPRNRNIAILLAITGGWCGGEFLYCGAKWKGMLCLFSGFLIFPAGLCVLYSLFLHGLIFTDWILAGFILLLFPVGCEIIGYVFAVYWFFSPDEKFVSHFNIESSTCKKKESENV